MIQFNKAAVVILFFIVEYELFFFVEEVAVFR